jgi:hypothetical protein
VHASVRSINPVVVHLLERDAVSFQVVDRSQVDGVRGEWVGDYPGVVRPMLEWTVDVQPIAGTERRLESRAGA